MAEKPPVMFPQSSNWLQLGRYFMIQDGGPWGCKERCVAKNPHPCQECHLEVILVTIL